MITFMNRLGRVFIDLSLLEQAFTHKSFHNENPSQSKGHNERLEFLGDAVLDLAMSHILMKQFPHLNEGDLSKLRASLVNERSLAEVANDFGFAEYLRLGRGELQTGGAQKPRLLASVFEAFIGALYLDGGFDVSLELVERLFLERILSQQGQVHFARDYKTRLQELTQDTYRQAPQYIVLEESGPDHEKIFVVQVSIQGQEIARGQGRSKKIAEQDSARIALEKLNQSQEEPVAPEEP